MQLLHGLSVVVVVSAWHHVK